MLGTSETVFAPEESLTHGMLVTILYRNEGEPATNRSIPFADISEWAVTTMNWGVGRDYIFSRAEGDIAPSVAATRAEIAAFIHRYIVDYVK